MPTKNDNRIMYYGLSMYGGYYAELLVNDKRVYFHENLLRELKNKCVNFGLRITKDTPRFDN